MDRRGLAAGVSAYVIWGTLPVYMKALKHVSPADVVAWRVLSALLFAFIIMAAAGGLEEFIRTLKDTRRLAMLAASGVLIAINWTFYVVAVVNDPVLETRSDARSVGNECVSTCSTRGSPSHEKTNTTLNHHRGTLA